ncbi:hypothetical protein ACFV9D_05380 [Streptomyces sp. NPDC059875]|uniref:hypothetical protein n=1 Tax=unclassified Streptomyces TaxID=2593676 RepID=UPI00364DD8CA
MNDSAPAPEDDEPTSITEKAKNLCKKHEGKVVFAISAALLVAGVLIKQAMDQNGTEGAEDTESAEDIEGSEVTADAGAASDSPTAKDPRKSPAEHEVSGYTRTLPDGRVIDIDPYTRGGRSDGADEDEAEEPGEAAA